MANTIQQALVGTVSAAAAGTRGIESSFEKSEKQEPKAQTSNSKQSQAEQATAKAQDSLAAARKQSYHRSHSSSMLKLMEAKGKAGK